MRCGGYKFHNLLIPLSRTTNSIKFTHLTTKSYLWTFAASTSVWWDQYFEIIFKSSGALDSCDFSMDLPLLRLCKVYSICVALLHVWISHSPNSHLHIQLQHHTITLHPNLQLHLVLYIQHNAIHFHPNPIALCCQRDLAISHSHRYISLTVLQLA